MKKIFSILLSVLMIISAFALPASAEEIYVENKVWFELNGNAKLFIDTEAEDYADRFTMEFLPGVDYSGFLAKPTGDFTTDKAAITNPGYGGAALPYTTDKNPTSTGTSTPIDLKTGEDGNLYYTFEENTYLIRPTENVIKVAYTQVDTSDLTNEETIARYASMKEGSTINVPDGKYKKIGFFTAIRMNYSKSLEISFYYKEDAAPTTVSIDTLTYGTTASDLYFKNLTSENSTADWNCQHSFTRIELDADPTKTLEKIHIIDDGKKTANRSWPAFILSSWGVEKTVGDIIAELDELNEKGIADNAALEEIKAKVAELEEKNATLSAEEQEIYDTAKALIKEYEDANAAEIEKAKLTQTAYNYIPLGSGANSKVFAEHGTTIEGIDDPTSELYTSSTYDYVYDFVQDYWYDGNKTLKLGVDETDGDLYTWTHKPVYYKHTSTHSGSYIPLDSNNNWTLPYLDGENVKYLTYNLKPTEKVIQLSGPWLSGYQQMTEKASQAYSLKHNSMKSVTVDVSNENYKNIYFLASTGISNSEVSSQYFTADVYYEGETTPTTVNIKILKNNISSSDPELGSLTALLNEITGKEHSSIWYYTSEMGYASSYGWYSYEIPCDMTKKVDKLTFTISASNRTVLIASMTGEKPSIVDILSKIDNTETDIYNYKAQLNKLNIAEEILERENINLQLADESLYAKYTQLKANLEAFEEIKPTLKPSGILEVVGYKNALPTVYVNLFNPSEIAGKKYSILLTYYDEKGNFITSQIKDFETTEKMEESFSFKPDTIVENASTIKAMMLESLSTMKPLAESVSTKVVEQRTFMFVGDSITHADLYPFYTETYFVTRFPLQAATFVNAAKSGGTAKDALGRYEWDIKGRGATDTVIMFGMNDAQRGYYVESSTATKAEKEGAINNCISNIEALAGMIEAEGSNITIMTPSIFDDRENYTTTENAIGLNGALAKIGELGIALAEAKNYSVIDTNTLTAQINERYKNSGEVEMISTDRVHPNANGYYVLAYNVIRNLFKDSGLVAQVTIDATNKTATSENSTVDRLVVSENEISYTYLPKALPIPVDNAYTVANTKYVPLTDELNREIIKVTGLADGTYTVKADGKVLGEFTATELALGINIATLENNPSQKQAKKVYESLNKKHNNTIKMRHLAYAEDYFRDYNLLEDAEKRADAVANLPASTYVYDFFDNFDGYKTLLPEWIAQNEQYLITARNDARPVEHTVEIIKK